MSEKRDKEAFLWLLRVRAVFTAVIIYFTTNFRHFCVYIFLCSARRRRCRRAAQGFDVIGGFEPHKNSQFQTNQFHGFFLIF